MYDYSYISSLGHYILYVQLQVNYIYVLPTTYNLLNCSDFDRNVMMWPSLKLLCIDNYSEKRYTRELELNRIE